MTNEELLKLREELKREILNEIEKVRPVPVWGIYCRDYLWPKIDDCFSDIHKRNLAKNCISSFARIMTGKRNVLYTTSEELEYLKPMIEEILCYFKGD